MTRKIQLASTGLFLLFALTGCATSVFNTATNVPITTSAPRDTDHPVDIGGENAVLLAFSGGGLRAAAFAHGVLKALGEIKTPTGDLLDDLTFVSSVSGGSLAAGYYGLYGRDGLNSFREKVLLRDYESNMNLSVFQPKNILRLIGGGLNDRQNFGETLDRQIFHGATFADLYRNPKPHIRILATDLYNGIAFPFIPRVFSSFCSDIHRYSVADAVAASMALPLVFAPVVLRTYPEHCVEPLAPIVAKVLADPESNRQLKAAASAMSSYRDRQHGGFIKLVDGGISDNFGLSTIILSRAILGEPYAPMTERDAVRIRRLIFIVVDASRRPHGEWASQNEGPGGVDLALRAIDAATDIAARYSADSFSRMVSDWQDSVIRFRCALATTEVARLRGSSAKWDCADVKFSVTFLTIDRLEPEFHRTIDSIDTRLTLTAEKIDATIEGARRGTHALQRLREYVQDQGVSILP